MDEARRRKLLGDSPLGRDVLTREAEARAQELGSQPQPLSARQRQLLGASAVGKLVLKERDARAREGSHG